MGTTTTYLGLFKAAGTDLVDPEVDVNDALDLIDGYAANHNHDGTGTNGVQLDGGDLIFTSPDTTQYKVVVANGGALSTEVV